MLSEHMLALVGVRLGLAARGYCRWDSSGRSETSPRVFGPPWWSA